MNDYQESVKEAVKRFLRWSYSKFENILNLSWERRKIQYLNFVVYIVATFVILIGAPYELYDTITSGDGSFVVAYIVVTLVTASDGLSLIMNRVKNVEEIPKHIQDERVAHMIGCFTKVCSAIYLVVGCYDRLPSVRETGRIQKVHFMVLIVSHAFPIVSSVEFIVAYQKLYRAKKIPERTGETHE